MKKIALVVFASDDGLCGAFNINLFKQLVGAVHHWQAKGVQDNAVKLLGKLQLEYNKLRQQGITTELLDIAGGQRDL